MNDLVLYFHVYHGSDEEESSQALGLEDTEFSHSGAQCAAVEPKDLCSAVLAAHPPMRLLKYPDNIVTLNLIQRFLGSC